MEKIIYRVLGVMSGTSLDGIDLAVVEFQKNSFWEYKILETETVAYPKEWKDRLGDAVTYGEFQLLELNSSYTSYLGAVISGFLRGNNVLDLDAICSHGHTVKHVPEKGLTLQIGNLPELAEVLGLPVVCDFRVQDVKLGGQGAPLVPLGDELLFHKYEYCLNLGGFANISTSQNGRRIAYDICAVNTVMNHLAEKLGYPFDRNGDIAASGKINQELLEKLNALEFYKLAPPKSLGIEWVHKNVFPLMNNSEDIPSVLHTFAVHIAGKIAENFDGHFHSRVLVTGGGAFNSFLMENIELATQNQIVIPSAEVVNYKEALIFAFLGVLKLRNEVNVLSSVTGASRDHSSGQVFYPEKPDLSRQKNLFF